MKTLKSESPLNLGSLCPWERIKAVMSHYKYSSVSAFARDVGLNRGENLYQIKRGNNGISRELVYSICKRFPDISKSWLLMGENQMLLSDNPLELMLSKVITIPFFMNVPDDPQQTIPDKTLYLSKDICNTAELATVCTHNALFPHFKPGSILYLKLWDLDIEPIYGEVYILKTRIMQTFRIIRQGKEPDTFRLTTYNTEMYDDITVSIEDVISLYHVCGVSYC